VSFDAHPRSVANKLAVKLASAEIRECEKVGYRAFIPRGDDHHLLGQDGTFFDTIYAFMNTGGLWRSAQNAPSAGSGRLSGWLAVSRAVRIHWTLRSSCC
jgi:hypothetical protein